MILHIDRETFLLIDRIDRRDFVKAITYQSNNGIIRYGSSSSRSGTDYYVEINDKIGIPNYLIRLLRNEKLNRVF